MISIPPAAADEESRVKAMNSGIMNRCLMAISLLRVLRVGVELLLVHCEILRRNREHGSGRVHDTLSAPSPGGRIEVHVINEEPMRRLVCQRRAPHRRMRGVDEE